MKTCKKCKNEFSPEDFRSRNSISAFCTGCRKKSVDAVNRCRSKKQEFVAEYKRAKGCHFCGFTEPIALDLHHTDPSNKKSTVADLLMRNATLEAINEELAKCVGVCANCHRMVHAGLRSF